MKMNMQAQKNWQLFQIVCECLACLDHNLTVFSESVTTSEEFVIVHHIHSVGAPVWRDTKAATNHCLEAYINVSFKLHYFGGTVSNC